MLRLSLGLFFFGLVLYLIPQQKEMAIAFGILSLPLFLAVDPINILSLKYPELPYRTRLNARLYTFIIWVLRQLPMFITQIPSLLLDIHLEIETFEDLETYTAGKSYIENEVDALLWLYTGSSTSSIRHLVIHALAGLPPDRIARAKKVFSTHWAEIRDEKERMLMDCMVLARDEYTRWIPKDIPNIDHRIEPLLRLEILFPELRRSFPSGIFGEHNLDFSKKLSNTLSITLSSIDDAHIQKPVDQKQVIDALLADRDVHHPIVWKNLLDRYMGGGKLFHDRGDALTIGRCIILVKGIYLPEGCPPESCGCTLVHASVIYCKPDILKGLLSFFESFDLHKDAVDPERRLLLAIVRALVPDSAPSAVHSGQHYPFHHDSTISKYQLLCVALRVIDRYIHDHPGDHPSKQWQTDVFQAILSYIMSNSFTGSSLSNLEDSEFKELFWTCRSYALVCMASLMDAGPEYCVVEPAAEWATKPLFLNILRVIHDEGVADGPCLSAVQAFPDLPLRFDSIVGIVAFLLGQAFSRGILNAYEAFEEKGSLHYIAEKSSLHPELVKGLRGYITGLSEANSRKLPDIQSDRSLGRHIQDLHRAHVIRCICASIVRSNTSPRPILSSLASIAPYHDEWFKILEILNSPDHEYSVQCYTLHPADNVTQDDVKRWKKDMKEIVRILAECLEEEKGRNKGTNQLSTSSNNLTGGPEIHESGLRSDPNTDIELGVFRVPGLTSSLEVKNLSQVNRVQASEICATHKSRIENELDALRCLYETSSTSGIHRLVIQALAGLSPDHKACAEEIFSPRWAEIRDEKERMLMDCMELARDEPTQWIPKDIHNIGGRIELLLRLEILFPALCRRFPSRLFEEHNLDFSRKLSNNLSITLSSIDDAHIQKPKEQNPVVMDALADNDVHHPVVWKKLSDRYVDKETFLRDMWDVFTIEMCFNLVTSIYLPEDSPPESYSCTLVYAIITSHKKEILKGLLTFFSASELHNDPVDPERRLLLAIVRALAPDSASSTNNSHQHHRFHHESTISKYRLLRVALHAINKAIHDHPVDDSSKQWRTNVFREILSYIQSDLFTGCSLHPLEYSEFKDPFWTCRAYALACMASLMGRDPKYCVDEPAAEWVKKPSFLYILRVIHDERVADAPRLPPVRVIHDPPQSVGCIIGVVGLLLDQAFSREIRGAYEAFQEEKGLGDLAVKNSLHPELIKLLHGYITGLLKSNAGNLSAIQSDDFLHWHIQDLHQVRVIGFICASITYSDTPRRRILSSLVSIHPNHSEWDEIVKTLSENDDYSFEKYVLDRNTLPDDQERLKESMKATVRILAKCLEAERDPRNGINWLLKRLNYYTSSAETRREARLRKGKERVQDPEGGH
ncbi:hypothetical protein ARMGADRAFT_1093042 [Armillaria gallica]|uniref:Uncharacterized protein n=1 Tax=Armillaria gallica TaxID=47427 RepID=A0A2H3CK43_ARMGA|nr:hypothetical protein ARMGADRAFT_1093042 [Armillaria gallica]